MKKITALIALTIFTIKVSCAQTSDNYGVVATQVQNIVGAGVKFEPIEIFTSSQIAHTAEGQYLQLKVDEAKLRHLLLSKKELIELIVPSFDGSNMHLLLYQHEKTAENFESILIKGDVRERAAAPLFTLYQGIIKGDMNSLVAITVLEDEINGVISSREGNINLGKNAIDKSSYVLYNDKQLHLPLNFKCGNSTDSIISYTSEQLSGNKLMSLSYCQKIEFTCDYDMYLHFGSNAGAVINYVISLFNVVGTLYNNEGINMFVKPIVTYTTPDTYCSTSSSCALTSFKLNGFLAGANIYHLLSRDVNGNGGRADLGSLTCAAAAYSNIDGSFNAFPSYSWDANVVAHEMGHNLNSQHTHECAWNGNATAIDNCNIYWGSATLLGPLQNNCSGGFNFPLGTGGFCSNGPSPGLGGGTVMSYCHGCSSIGINFSNGFGLQPGNVMRNFINNALCFSNCNNECLSTIYVGAPVLSGNSANYNAFNTLYSGTTLYNGSNVTFTATNLVLLNPGFVAQYGSTLVANNTPCTPLLSSENLKRHLVTSEPDLKNVEVFPNPFTHNFEVLFYSNTNELATINVYTMLGNKVNLALTRHLSKGLNKFSVDAESLLPGIYMLEIRASEKSKMIRIIKN